MAQGSTESSLALILLTYAYQMVCIAQVQLRENGGLVKGGEDRVDEGQRILVLAGDVV